MGSILPTDQTLNIAVAGLGRMGKRHVHTLVGRVPRAKVVAVCSTWDNEVQWAQEAYKGTGIQVFNSYEDMIQLPSLNAVWISTSTDVHASQTLAAIKKGLHVLCEKPLSTDLAEVRSHWTPLVRTFSTHAPRHRPLERRTGPACRRRCQCPPRTESHGGLLPPLRRLVPRREGEA